ncbi:MAG: DUF1905 domain-containing protein [Planctomycetota bacterium]
MTRQRFEATLFQPENTHGHAVELPFDPREVFGKARAPVTVTINDHTFRTTIATYGGRHMIGIRRSNREAAGIEPGARVTLEVALDAAPRVIKPARDLARALRETPPAWEAWNALSDSHQKEYADAIEEAKKPETRARRIRKTVQALEDLAAKRKLKATKKKAAKKKARS